MVIIFLMVGICGLLLGEFDVRVCFVIVDVVVKNVFLLILKLVGVGICKFVFSVFSLLISFWFVILFELFCVVIFMVWVYCV